MNAVGMPSVMWASILRDIYVTSHVGLFVNVIGYLRVGLEWSMSVILILVIVWLVIK